MGEELLIACVFDITLGNFSGPGFGNSKLIIFSENIEKINELIMTMNQNNNKELFLKGWRALSQKILKAVFPDFSSP